MIEDFYLTGIERYDEEERRFIRDKANIIWFDLLEKKPENRNSIERFVLFKDDKWVVHFDEVVYHLDKEGNITEENPLVNIFTEKIWILNKLNFHETLNPKDGWAYWENRFNNNTYAVFVNAREKKIFRLNFNDMEKICCLTSLSFISQLQKQRKFFIEKDPEEDNYISAVYGQIIRDFVLIDAKEFLSKKDIDCYQEGTCIFY